MLPLKEKKTSEPRRQRFAPSRSLTFPFRYLFHSYIRIKRRNQTFCLLCNHTDSIQSVKEQLAMATKQHMDDAAVGAEDMRLLWNDSILQDSDTLRELKDDCVLHLVFKVADDEYESVDIVSTDLQEG